MKKKKKKASQKCYESSARELPSLSHTLTLILAYTQARAHALIKVLRGPRTCQMRSRQLIGFFAHGHQLKQYAVYAHGPKLNNEAGMALHACFYFRGKKENSTKKKNKHGDICFLINYKFLCKISFKLISCLFL